MVIARSVNNDFGPWKINDRPSDGMDLQAERAGVGGPLAVSGSGRYNFLVLNAKPDLPGSH